MSLELLLRLSGCAVSLLGAAVVVPNATLRLLACVGSLATAAARSAESIIRRVLRRPRSVQIQAATATLIATAVSVTATGGSSWSVESNKPTAERLDSIERRLHELESSLPKMKDDLTGRLATSVGDLERRIEDLASDVGKLLEAKEREQDEVDARALPALVDGLLVTTFAAELSLHPDFGVAVLFAQVWVVGYSITVLLTYSDRRDHRAPRPV